MDSKVLTIYGQPYGFQGQPYGSRSTMGPTAPILLMSLNINHEQKILFRAD